MRMIISGKARRVFRILRFMAQKEKALQRVCAWCGKTMGWKPGGPGITHGICQDCQHQLRRLQQGGRDGPGNTAQSQPS